MSLEMWSQVKKFSNGESLNAETLNVPIGQLGDRTSYLYARLKELLSSGKMSSVILTGVDLSTADGKSPKVGNAVYLDRNTNTFSTAKATMSLYDDFTAADSAFTVGILQSRDGNIGNVLIYGNMDLNPAGNPMMVVDMIESGEEFRPGRYYLSANEAGHLTAHPNGPLIYVCTISGEVNGAGGISGTAVMSPQFLDIGTSHVHRTAVLTARPAGTKSIKGYLPIDESGNIALRFGGTWTSTEEVDYTFYLDQESPDWPDGVYLKWLENGKSSPAFSVKIHAPDEEVRISNGLTARLSLPDSTSSKAYTISEVNKRTWETLTFPDAGKGWLGHEAVAVASSESVDGLKVAVKGKFDVAPIKIFACFPSSIQVLGVGTDEPGTTFTYGGITYQFTADIDSYTSENGYTPVRIGSCLADSALYMAQAVNKDIAAAGSEGAFAVFEGGWDGSSSSSSSGSGSDASLVAVDAAEVNTDMTFIISRRDYSWSGANTVKGADGIKMAVFDANGWILSGDPFISDISSYAWKKSGDISVMVYQDVSVPVSIPAKTISSAIAVDDEPDAIYDYVIGMEPKIANYWPPVPVKSAALIVNGIEMDNKALLPENPTVSFGGNTIHWFEDDEGRKPWPEDIKWRNEQIDPSEDKTEVMHWVRSFQGATGPVTSLQAREGSPFKIYGYGTDGVANTGDLEIAADFDFSVEAGGAPGFLVPKRARRGRLIAGPVVERIVGGSGVSIISKAGCPEGQGTVIVALDNGAYRSHFTDIALENAEQAKIGMFPYIRLKGYSGSSITYPSAFTAMMRVPTNLPDGKYALSIFASVFGEEGFSSDVRTACLDLSYNILPDFSSQGDEKYSNLKTSLLVPDSKRTVLIPFGHETSSGIVYNGFDPVYVTTNDRRLEDEDDVVSEAFGQSIPAKSDFALQTVSPELRPGYLVGIRIARAVTQAEGATPYTGALGFINLSWSLVSTDEYWRSVEGSVTNPLDGVEIRANTAGGMRNAVETIGEALGATVIRKNK